MGAVANYHNLRDKNGRFIPKGSKTKTVAKKKVSKKVDSVGKEIYDMFILDCSGSMNSIKQETIKGFNLVIDGIVEVYNSSKVPSYCSLVEFNDGKSRVKYSNNLCTIVENLHNSNYYCSGGTPLYDAIATGILEMKNYLYIQDKLDNKDISVTITVLTDGEENQSRNYNKQQINALVNQMKNDYNWTINFIGAGSKAYVEKVATDLGFFASNTINYTANSEGTQGIFQSFNNARSAKSKLYVEKDVNNNFGFFSKD